MSKRPRHPGVVEAPGDKLATIDAALDDDAPASAAEADRAVKELGIDVAALSARIRAQVTAADDADRRARFAEARRAYAAAVERLAERAAEPARPRARQVEVLEGLLARAPAGEVSMHFHKYDQATDAELDEMIRALRHLLGEPDGGGDGGEGRGS